MTDEQLQAVAAINPHMPAGDLAAELLANREQLAEFEAWKKGRIGVEEYYAAKADIARLTADNAALREQNNRAGWVRRADRTPKQGRLYIVWLGDIGCWEKAAFLGENRWLSDSGEVIEDVVWYMSPKPPEV